MIALVVAFVMYGIGGDGAEALEMDCECVCISLEPLTNMLSVMRLDGRDFEATGWFSSVQYISEHEASKLSHPN